MRYNNILDLIGNTPIVEISELSPNSDVKIFAKLEGQNPTGSVKDRVAKFMIDDAEEKGLLSPGQIILEPTSGNTGIGLALIASIKGYSLKVVLPDAVSRERIELLESFGAEIIFSPGNLGTNGSVAMAKKISKENPEWFMPLQYENENNPRAHYEGTGQEIIDDIPDLDVFVSGLGTGGTLTGVGRRLKEYNPAIKIVAAAPHPGDQVQGLRSLEEGYIPPVFDESILDARIVVDSETSFKTTRDMTQKTGVFAGISCGAVVRAAQRVAERMDSGKIVVLLADGGWKYLSTGLWTREYSDIVENVGEKLWW